MKYSLLISFWLLACACVFIGKDARDRQDRQMWAMLMIMNLVAGTGFQALQEKADPTGGSTDEPDDSLWW